VFTQNRMSLPDRQQFRREVDSRQLEIVTQTGSRSLTLLHDFPSPLEIQV